METNERLQVLAAQTDQQIAWALAHPGTSEWLKQSLEAALDCDPVALLNELEILKRLLRITS